MKQQWTELLDNVSDDTRSLLSMVAQQSAAELADRFYRTLLNDEKASAFVTHEAVDARLHASLQRWVTHLFTRLDATDVPSLVAEQQHIGIVHARLNIPIELVLRASRHVKEAVLEMVLLQPARYRIRLRAAVLAVGLIDVAMEIMSGQYSASHDSETRTDEAYRNYAATINMSLEREYQRTALSDWSNRLLQDVMIGGADAPFASISQSPFGLWLRHKAPALFSSPAELDAIRASLDTIDTGYLPDIARAMAEGDLSSLRRIARLIVSEVEKARRLLDSMFDHLLRMESGSDALTHLLNRRFLPSVLSREIAMARNKGIVFSVLLLDIDHFKTINDRYGHDTGDRTLQQVAQVLSRLAGSGDFLFRYGGEEFLILCAESDAAKAGLLAERIRREVERQPIDAGDGSPISVTVSIGIATYEGHPDYQRLIRQADQALYQAKTMGRNRTVDFASLVREEALA